MNWTTKESTLNEIRVIDGLSGEIIVYNMVFTPDTSGQTEVSCVFVTFITICYTSDTIAIIIWLKK